MTLLLSIDTHSSGRAYLVLLSPAVEGGIGLVPTLPYGSHVSTAEAVGDRGAGPLLASLAADTATYPDFPTAHDVVYRDASVFVRRMLEAGAPACLLHYRVTDASFNAIRTNVAAYGCQVYPVSDLRRLLATPFPTLSGAAFSVSARECFIVAPPLYDFADFLRAYPDIMEHSRRLVARTLTTVHSAIPPSLVCHFGASYPFVDAVAALSASAETLRPKLPGIQFLRAAAAIMPHKHGDPHVTHPLALVAAYVRERDSTGVSQPDFHSIVAGVTTRLFDVAQLEADDYFSSFPFPTAAYSTLIAALPFYTTRETTSLRKMAQLLWPRLAQRMKKWMEPLKKWTAVFDNLFNLLSPHYPHHSLGPPPAHVPALLILDYALLSATRVCLDVVSALGGGEKVLIFRDPTLAALGESIKPAQSYSPFTLADALAASLSPLAGTSAPSTAMRPLAIDEGSETDADAKSHLETTSADVPSTRGSGTSEPTDARSAPAASATSEIPLLEPATPVRSPTQETLPVRLVPSSNPTPAVIDLLTGSPLNMAQPQSAPSTSSLQRTCCGLPRTPHLLEWLELAEDRMHPHSSASPAVCR